MSCYPIVRLSSAVLIIWLSCIHLAFSDTRQVLLIYDERLDLPGLSMMDASFVRKLTDNSKYSIDVYRETLDLSRFGTNDNYLPFMRDYLRTKYAHKKVDVVVAMLGPSLNFLLNSGETIFPGTPIVFCGIDRREFGNRSLPPHVTGILLKREFAPTLELALKLHPETKNVVVVGGSSKFDKQLVEDAKNEFEGYQNQLKFNYMTNLPLKELLTKLSQLPPQTVVLYTTMFQDGAGVPFIPHKVIEQISAASNAPVYGFVDQYLGRGIVGGRLYSLNSQGEEVAKITLKILDGTSTANLPLFEYGASETLLDWRQMKRWNLNQSQLPAGSTIRFRQPSLWNQYKHYIIGAIGIIALQSFMIGRLIMQRSRRRKIEAQLRESESRFRTLADTAPVMIWMSGVDKLTTWCNQRLLNFVGHTLEQTNFGWRQNIHPDDFQRCNSIYQTSFNERRPYTKEFRIKRHDGQYRWVLDSGIPLFSPQHEFAGFIGSWIDITERIDAELENLRHREELAHITRVRSMGEFSVSVAHELKQPLTAILSNAEAAELFLNNDPPAIHEVKDILSDIRKDDLRARDIIQKMRSFLEYHEVVRKPLDLNHVVEEILRLMNAEAMTRRIAMSFEPERNLPPIPGDRVHLQQVVMNLVLNGFDAMATLPETARQLRVRTGNSSKGSVIIAVSDSGPGIPTDQIPKLFEPFFTTKRDGLGMGLCISRTIMEAHDGVLWVENNPDFGATFYAELPAN